MRDSKDKILMEEKEVREAAGVKVSMKRKHVCTEDCYIYGNCRGVKRIRKTPTSYEIFESFVTRGFGGDVDTSGILTQECFEKWLESRKQPPKNASRAFKDALKSIIKGSNRCRPFPEEIERDLLLKLRRDEEWPCFKNSERISLGARVWDSITGFHEERRRKQRRKLPQKRPQPAEAVEMELSPPQKLSFNEITIDPIPFDLDLHDLDRCDFSDTTEPHALDTSPLEQEILELLQPTFEVDEGIVL